MVLAKVPSVRHHIARSIRHFHVFVYWIYFWFVTVLVTIFALQCSLSLASVTLLSPWSPFSLSRKETSKAMLLRLDSALSSLNNLNHLCQPSLLSLLKTLSAPSYRDAVFLLSKSDHVIFPLKISQLLCRNKSDYLGGFTNWSLLFPISFFTHPHPIMYHGQALINWCVNTPRFFLATVPFHIIFSLSRITAFFFVWPTWKSSTHPPNFSWNITSFMKLSLISPGWVQCYHIFLLFMYHTTIIILHDYSTHQTT